MGSEGSIPGGVQGQPVSERDFCSGKSTVLLGPLHHLGTLVGRQMGPNKQPRLSSTQCHQDSVSNSGSAVRAWAGPRPVCASPAKGGHSSPDLPRQQRVFWKHQEQCLEQRVSSGEVISGEVSNSASVGLWLSLGPWRGLAHTGSTRQRLSGH